MRCYKHGSIALEHESDLRVPAITWLGIKSRDLAAMHESGAAAVSRPSGMMPDENHRASSVLSLTARNRASARRLLGMIDENSDDVEDLDCRRELQVMLFLGIKAEIQGVDNGGDLTEWLDDAIGRHFS